MEMPNGSDGFLGFQGTFIRRSKDRERDPSARTHMLMLMSQSCASD